MKALLKQVIPPILFSQLKKLSSSKYGWKGNYSSWEEAEANSDGYAKENIVRKVKEALLEVKNGEAVFERDSVLFYEEDYNWQLLSALFYVGSRLKGDLHVLDFGGSLGSTYFQNIKFFERIDSFSWSVIEQAHYVEIGKEDFQTNTLRFYESIDACRNERNVNCLLLSSLLQYIKEPYALLDQLLIEDFPFIIIDRMPFNTKNKDRISVQIVPPEIYEASYPCHLLNEEKFIEYFRKNNFTLHTSFDAIDGKAIDYKYRGFIFERNQ